MAPIKIAVINQSTVVGDGEVSNVTAHIQTQVSQHFAPVWGIDAQLVFCPTKIVPAGYWAVYIMDTSDQPGALGYHTVTFPAAVPFANIFVKTTSQYKLSWSVTMSHEVLEMLADPTTNRCVFRQTTATAGDLLAYEVGDPVEADTVGYAIGSVRVSNFITPNWFLDNSQGPWDYKGLLKGPFTMLSGGYESLAHITASSGWIQATARTAVFTVEDTQKK